MNDRGYFKDYNFNTSKSYNVVMCFTTTLPF